ncbi:uncharacterized protein DFL_000657 [Arthrobotrys flagrans]|uniref:Uncharacterized protein n=1 Tax=Arthrobotrys flagrans TaxID=97331 RepID=A0A437AEC8_ARTFL|nr:hypothetical protein DFL_000657 [Arthrobotrys flagrans]
MRTQDRPPGSELVAARRYKSVQEYTTLTNTSSLRSAESAAEHYTKENLSPSFLFPIRNIIFCCIKGGSNDYGVITGSILGTVDTSRPFINAFSKFSARYPEASTNDSFTTAYTYCTGESDADPKSHIIFSSAITGTDDPRDALLIGYNDVFDIVDPALVLQPYFDGTIPNPIINATTRNGAVKAAADIFNLSQPAGTRYTMGAFAIYPDLKLLKNSPKHLEGRNYYRD